MQNIPYHCTVMQMKAIFNIQACTVIIKEEQLLHSFG